MSVSNVDIVQVAARTHLVPEEAAGDIDLLAPDDHDLLARECLLGDSRRQTAQEMPLAVNDDGRRGERGHFGVGLAQDSLSFPVS